MREIKLLGIPFDFGQDHTGVREAFRYLKENGLIEGLRAIAPVVEMMEISFPLKFKETNPGSIKQVAPSSFCNEKINDTIEDLDLTESFLLNIGGDHGMALGTVHGVLSHHPEAVVVWADAHGDINTPDSTPSGNFHGMPLAFLLGLVKRDDFSWIRRNLLPQKLIFFGPRDLDQGEKDLIEKHSIQYYSSEEINRVGAHEILSMALHRADPLGIHPIHLSFDVDIFDHQDIVATGTKVSDGPKLEEIFLLGGVLADTGRLRSMDLVEFNPRIGSKDEVRASSALILEFLECTLRQVFSPKTGRVYHAIPQNYFTAGIA